MRPARLWKLARANLSREAGSGSDPGRYPSERICRSLGPPSSIVNSISRSRPSTTASTSSRNASNRGQIARIPGRVIGETLTAADVSFETPVDWGPSEHSRDHNLPPAYVPWLQ